MVTGSIDSATEVLEIEALPVRVRKMSLVVSQGPDAGKRVAVDKPIFVVGKAPSCDLRVLDSTVSKNHFSIEQSGEGYVVRDLGSTNGTTLDGIRVKEAFLAPGARLTAGHVEMIFQPVFEQSADKIEEGLATFGNLVAASPAMKAIFKMLQKAAAAGTTVLLTGETGVGKSAIAKAIHAESSRADAPFVVFDCASVAPTLIESELFGVKRGAFTGAIESRPGACEQANGGVLFLDEIGDMPSELQAKLLRVLEEKEVQRLGDTKRRKLDIHVIAATKVNLQEAVGTGYFRRDLYYRIAVLEVEVPPLRARSEDVPLLCQHFLSMRSKANSWSQFTPALREELETYAWPGNIRELRNVLERIECLGPDAVSTGDKSDESISSEPALAFDLDRPFKEAKEDLISAFEHEYLKKLLERSDGRIAPAAREAGLNRKYFYDLLRKHGLHGRES